VVQDIEELASETQSHSLREAKDPLHPDIPLYGVEPAQHVAPEIACCPAGGCENATLLRNFAAGISRTEKLQGHSRIQVQAGLNSTPAPRIMVKPRSTGGAELANASPSTDQPPYIARTVLSNPGGGDRMSAR